MWRQMDGGEGEISRGYVIYKYDSNKHTIYIIICVKGESDRVYEGAGEGGRGGLECEWCSVCREQCVRVID